MRFLIRLILLVIIVAVGYALWPRTPHPTTFQPATVASLEMQAWKGAGTTTSLDSVIALYKLYDLQYHFAPFTAVSLAQNSSRALRILKASPDAMDRENVIPLFVDNFKQIKEATHAAFDADLAARQLYVAWSQAIESAPASDIAKSLTAFWATRYGKPASAFNISANAYAEAMLKSGFGPGQSPDWEAVEDSLKTAYTQLAENLK